MKGRRGEKNRTQELKRCRHAWIFPHRWQKNWIFIEKAREKKDAVFFKSSFCSPSSPLMLTLRLFRENFPPAPPPAPPPPPPPPPPLLLTCPWVMRARPHPCEFLLLLYPSPPPSHAFFHLFFPAPHTHWGRRGETSM